ncbi:MAG: alanine racemase [Cyanobacteria bacterium J06641_5]
MACNLGCPVALSIGPDRREFGGIVAIVLDRSEANVPYQLIIEASEVVPTSLLAAPPCQRAWVEIDLAALKGNIHQLRQHLQPQTILLAVVKADAYGHGAAAVARAAIAAGAQWLAVATLTEGVSLRQAQIEAPILVLGAIQTAAEVEAAVAWQLQPTLCDRAQISLFARTLAPLGQTVSVHVQLDTGMSRLGMPWQEAVPFVREIQQP